METDSERIEYAPIYRSQTMFKGCMTPRQKLIRAVESGSVNIHSLSPTLLATFWSLVDQRQIGIIDGKLILFGSRYHRWDFAGESWKITNLKNALPKIRALMAEGTSLKRAAKLYNVSDVTLKKYLVSSSKG